MLNNKNAVANVAVRDLDVATKFYKNTLGLTPVHEEGKELVVLRSGNSEATLVASRARGMTAPTSA